MPLLIIQVNQTGQPCGTEKINATTTTVKGSSSTETLTECDKPQSVSVSILSTKNVKNLMNFVLIEKPVCDQ